MNASSHTSVQLDKTSVLQEHSGKGLYVQGILIPLSKAKHETISGRTPDDLNQVSPQYLISKQV